MIAFVVFLLRNRLKVTKNGKMVYNLESSETYTKLRRQT